MQLRIVSKNKTMLEVGEGDQTILLHYHGALSAGVDSAEETPLLTGICTENSRVATLPKATTLWSSGCCSCTQSLTERQSADEELVPAIKAADDSEQALNEAIAAIVSVAQGTCSSRRSPSF
jgi:hypothetical protein